MAKQHIKVIRGMAACPECRGEVEVSGRGNGFLSHYAPEASAPCPVDKEQLVFDDVGVKHRSGADRRTEGHRARKRRVAAEETRRPQVHREKRELAAEKRRRQRISDRYALIDPDEEATLQGHDVEDAGVSVRARRGVFPVHTDDVSRPTPRVGRRPRGALPGRKPR